ncbi:MAG: chemotaxis protein CheW [Desulfobacteraceae bacterium]|nr:MAG: chemotaxis protein CheW [Desulfobacteraceae bacterium]
MQEKEYANRSCWKTIGVFGDFSCPELVGLIHCRNCFQYNTAGRSLFDREVPGEFLDEWTRNITAAKEPETRDAFSVIVFRVSGEWLALKTVYLQETTNPRPVHTVPFRTNKVFRGLVNINGELLLCVSLGDLTEAAEVEHAPAEGAPAKRMVVINKQGERYAFSVEEILGIYRISVGDLQKPPVTLAKSPSGVVETVFDLNDRKVGLLGEEKLIHALKRSLGS